MQPTLSATYYFGDGDWRVAFHLVVLVVSIRAIILPNAPTYQAAVKQEGVNRKPQPGPSKAWREQRNRVQQSLGPPLRCEEFTVRKMASLSATPTADNEATTQTNDELIKILEAGLKAGRVQREQHPQLSIRANAINREEKSIDASQLTTPSEARTYRYQSSASSSQFSL